MPFVIVARPQQPGRELDLPVAGRVWVPSGGRVPLPACNGSHVGQLEHALEAAGLYGSYRVEWTDEAPAALAEPLPLLAPDAGPVKKPSRRRG